MSVILERLLRKTQEAGSSLPLGSQAVYLSLLGRQTVCKAEIPIWAEKPSSSEHLPALGVWGLHLLLPTWGPKGKEAESGDPELEVEACPGGAYSLNGNKSVGAPDTLGGGPWNSIQKPPKDQVWLQTSLIPAPFRSPSCKVPQESLCPCAS